jgi:hypothetical protein
MKSEYSIGILLSAVALLIISGCITQEKVSISTLNGYLPQGKGLPDGFKLVFALNDSVPGVNMTDEIREVYGSKDIGPATAVVGKYWWGRPGIDYDAKVTIISLKNEDDARAATSNYLDNFKASRTVKLPGNISLINPVKINGHDATEIGDIAGDNTIRLLYLWNNKNLAVLVEGNSDRSASMKFASATGL